jgi:D-tagatose-1,6-bisphosphate aldolase subunit GatZ/KbaZ
MGRKEVQEALDRLFKNLSPRVPEGLISQYMPTQYTAVRAGDIASAPRDLAIDRICNVIDLYMQAGDLTSLRCQAAA